MVFVIDLYYSFRSPYCYFLNDRLSNLEKDWDVKINLRPVYPLAIRDPEFFLRSDPLRRAYHILDSKRVAEYLNIPYRRPIPDPVVSDLENDTFSEDQPFITPVTRLAAAASLNGDGFKFANSVMKMMWDGSTDNWHENKHLEKATETAGLNWQTLCGIIKNNWKELDKNISINQEEQRAAGHWGVPLMVLDGEPFYGQDRFLELHSRMIDKGLQRRE